MAGERKPQLVPRTDCQKQQKPTSPIGQATEQAGADAGPAAVVTWHQEAKPPA